MSRRIITALTISVLRTIQPALKYSAMTETMFTSGSFQMRGR